jgi:hypothetical protein
MTSSDAARPTGPPGPLIALPRPDPGFLTALAVGLAGCLAYALARPWAPDLAAQIARAAAAGSGVHVWWNSWYGGTAVPSYSVLCGPLMHAVGVRGTGILATAAICGLSGVLARPSARPRLTAAAAAVAATANLVSGRITFAVGLAVALTSVVLFVRGHRRAALLPALAAALASPLAALVPATVGTAYALVERPRSRGATLAIAAVAPVGVLSLLYSGPSVMPIDLTDLVPCLIACGALAAFSGSRVVRGVALLSAAVAIAAYLVPSPIGSNAVRLPLLAGLPLLIATARRVRTPWYVVTLLAGGTWLGVNVQQDLAAAAGPTTSAAFYQPLLARFPHGLADERIEVVDPSSHGDDLYLASRLPLARGWERQIDYAENRLFYDGSLSAATYRAWLDRLAVGWVAVPDAPLDFGSQAEGRLIGAGLPYLSEVWHGAHWTVYSVRQASPIASGAATVQSYLPTRIVLSANRAGSVLLHARFSRSLHLFDAAGRPVPDADIEPVDGGAAYEFSVPAAGTWFVAS